MALRISTSTRIVMLVVVALLSMLVLAATAAAATEAPGTQSSPDEAFVDPAVDIDRGAGALAYGANAAPADGGASAEVAVRGAANVPTASGGGAATPSGDLPYTGLTVAGMLVIAISFLMAGLGVHLHARRMRRERAADGVSELGTARASRRATAA